MSELTFIPNSTSRSVSKRDARKIDSDEQLLMARMAQGDEAALQELIAIHGETLARLVGRLTAWHCDCDDVLQEVLLTVWQKADLYKGEGSLEGWLKRIAINRCRNYFRTLNAIKRKIEKFAGTLGSAPQTTNASTVYPTNEDVEQPELQEAMMRLSDPDRSVLVLFYLEEMTGEEVALALGIKLETLHVRLHRARKKLKKLMVQG